MITLQFVLGEGISAKAISWFSAGHFSHVDVIVPQGLLGARPDSIGGAPPGVWIRPQYYDTWSKVVLMEIAATKEQEEDFIDFLHDQLAKPYDMTAIWAFVINRDWREVDSWFCSELISAALEHAGICSRMYDGVNKITPVSLAVVASAMGALIRTVEG